MAKSVAAPAANIHAAETARKRLVEVYKKEEKVDYSISPLYKHHLGNVVTRSINGISIAVPVDGTRHKIPRSFADDLDRVIISIDASIKKASKMASVADNAEKYPGELPMF